jgi:hypothetical protein
MAARKTSRSVGRPEAVAAFLATVRPERRDLIETLDTLVRTAAPGLEPGPYGRMIGYGPFHYRYASGREGDAYAVAIMDGAQAVSLYALGTEDGRYLTENRASRLGAVAVGKSCVRIKRLDGVELDELRSLVAEAARQHRDGELGEP